MGRGFIGALGALVTIATLVWVASARAQQTPATASPPAATTDQYAQVVREAVHEFGAGNFIEARTLFARAHELKPSARTLRGLGLCAYELKHYVDASNELAAALHDKRNPLTGSQRDEAVAAIAKAQRYVGTLVLDLAPATAAVLVDGRAVATRELALDAGDHTLIASAPGYRTSELAISLPGGQKTAAKLVLLALDRSAAREPSSRVSGFVDEANAAFVRGQLPRARSLYLAALKATPESPEAWRGLGVSSAHMGEKREAAAALQKYLQLRPDADDAAAIRLKLDEVEAK